MSVKLNSNLRFKILEKTGIYANRFGISEPRVLLTTKEVLETPKEMTEEEEHLLTSTMEFPICSTT